MINFIKSHIGNIVYFSLTTIVFLSVSALYGYGKTVANIFYAAILSGFLGLCLGIRGYTVYRKRCKALYFALESKDESGYYLPEPVDLTERLYTEIIQESDERRRELIYRMDAAKKDMADYYTMWTHQIKTPIAAMHLILSREQDGTGGAKSRKQATVELFKIEQYADMALQYARFYSISSDMLFEKHDISAIIRKAVKKYSILFIGSGLSFSMEEFECKAVTDEKWLGFVIEQLLSNALKYTARGGIRIYGADKNGKETGRKETAQIVIEDTGIGIRQNDLPRIFERGFTGYNGRVYNKSTGIGLYLCKQILDRLSHGIKVESVEGKGTKVLLLFDQERYNVTEV